MKSRIVKKKIDRVSQHSKSIDQSSVKRDVCGFGHIIIPNDVDREVYIRRVYDTYRCAIVTTYDDVINNVVVPKNLIQEIEFPSTPTQRGTLIQWINIPRINQVLIQNIICEEDISNPFEENTFSIVKNYEDITLSDITYPVEGLRVIHIKNESSNKGKIQFKVSGIDVTTTITLDGNGRVEVSSDDVIATYAENEFVTRVGSEQTEVVTLTMRDKKVEIKNSEESLVNLIVDLLKMYMATKTIDGKPIDPSSADKALQLILRFRKLLY